MLCYVGFFFSFWPTKAATVGVAANTGTVKLLKYGISSKVHIVKSNWCSGTQHIQKDFYLRSRDPDALKSCSFRETSSCQGTDTSFTLRTWPLGPCREPALAASWMDCSSCQNFKSKFKINIIFCTCKSLSVFSFSLESVNQDKDLSGNESVQCNSVYFGLGNFISFSLLKIFLSEDLQVPRKM